MTIVFSGLLLTACVTAPQSVVVDEQLAGSVSAQHDTIEKLKIPRRFKDELLRLYSADPVERATGAYQISKLGESAAPAVPYLADLLSDNTEVLLSHYLGGGFHSSQATSPAEEAAYALAKIGAPAIELLSERINDTDPLVRRLAARALGQTGSMVTVDTLLRAVADPDVRVRAAATIALGGMHHPVVAQKLMDVYPATAPDLQPKLIYVMSQVNDIIVVPFLIEQSASSSADIRASVVLALGKIRDARAVDTLIMALSDQDEIVRENAAYALRSFYSAKVMEALLGIMEDDIEGVRTAAVESLRALSGMDFGQNKPEWLNWWQQQQQAVKDKNSQ